MFLRFAKVGGFGAFGSAVDLGTCWQFCRKVSSRPRIRFPLFPDDFLALELKRNPVNLGNVSAAFLVVDNPDAGRVFSKSSAGSSASSCASALSRLVRPSSARVGAVSSKSGNALLPVLPGFAPLFLSVSRSI